MKLIAIVFLILLGGVERGFCWLRMKGPPIIVQNHRFCQKSPCCIHEANMSPCFDTPGCKLPECCGVIGDVDTKFTLTYEAKATILMSGELRVEMDGSGMESYFGHQYNLQSSFQHTNAKHILNVCHLSTCPQWVGNVYTMTVPIKVSSPSVGNASDVFDFVFAAHNEYNEKIYCLAIRVKIVSQHYVQAMHRLGIRHWR